jgi:hypothetical protein
MSFPFLCTWMQSPSNLHSTTTSLPLNSEQGEHYKAWCQTTFFQASSTLPTLDASCGQTAFPTSMSFQNNHDDPSHFLHICLVDELCQFCNLLLTVLSCSQTVKIVVNILDLEPSRCCLLPAVKHLGGDEGEIAGIATGAALATPAPVLKLLGVLRIFRQP